MIMLIFEDLLARHPGVVFDRGQVYNVVWEGTSTEDCRIVMNHIHNIREKIEDDPVQAVCIQTVWGVGYRFDRKINGLEHG